MTVVARDAGSGTWRLFERPAQIVTTTNLADVIAAFRTVEAACLAGKHAAGFVSYEAAPAFDPALCTRPVTGFPLLWFGIYDTFRDVSLIDLTTASPDEERWEPSISRQQYAAAFRRIQQLIRDGDTYQINYTYRLSTTLRSDPLALFASLASAHVPPFAAYVDTGEWAICSLSPELFFHRSGTHIESRPMKGTAPRGLWFEQDLERGRALQQSEKDRAENVMIVDMVRNDLGRIARPGTVRVTSLFDVERYPSVLQLTSTVAAETTATLVDVMAALFPAASITGTPKPRATEIIAEVECSPRRAYTGSVGFIDPGGRAQFNVAIRTAVVNRASNTAEYGVGGGIVADSNLDDEQRESVLKSRALQVSSPTFDLLETLLWTPDGGYVLIGRHLRRLLQSADYFGFAVDVIDARERLERLAADFANQPQRVRLLLSRRGAVELQASPQDPNEGFSEVTLAAAPIDRTSPFLYHKTTNRRVYEAAVRARPGFSDVLLFNDHGEITESTIANVVVEVDGTLVTPPVACGLLPGTLRGHLLDEGRIREGAVTIDMLRAAPPCFLLNSVRGFHPVSVRLQNS